MKHSARSIVLSLLISPAFFGCNADKTTADYLKSADNYLNNNNPPAAVIELKNALKNAPENADIRLLLGKVYLQQKQYRLAIHELQKAGELGIEPAQWQLPLIQALFSQQEYQKVLDESINLNQLPPLDQIQISLIRGISALRTGDTQGAVKYFDQAQANEMDNAYSKLSQAYLAQTKENSEQALALIDEAISLDSSLLEARLLKIQLLKSLRRLDETIAETQQIIMLEPNNLSFKLMQADNLLSAGRPEQARKPIETLLKSNPKHPYTNLLAAQMNFQTGHYVEAKTQAQIVLSSNDNSLVARAILGLSMFQLGEYTLADNQLSMVSPHIPKDHPLRRAIAQAQYIMGNIDEVSANLAQYQIQSETDLKLLENLAVGLAQKQELPLALELMDKVHQSNQDNETLARLGLMKLANQDDSGLADLAQALENDPTLQRYKMAPVIYYLEKLEYSKATELANNWLSTPATKTDGYNALGLTAIAQGELPKAADAFKQTLNINPSDVTALSYLGRLNSQDNPQLAISFLKRLIQLEPKSLSAIRLLSQLEYSQGDKEQAHHNFTQHLTQTEESNDNMRLAYAHFLSNNQLAQEALTELSKLSDLYQNSFSALKIKTINTFRIGHIDQALDIAQHWMNRTPTKEEPYIAVLDLAARKNDETLTNLTLVTVHKQFPDNLQFSVMGVRSSIKIKNYEQAFDIIQNIKDHRLQQILTAEVYADKGEMDSAIEQIQRLVNTQADSYSVRRLAQYCIQSGNTHKATQLLKKWLATTPKDYQAHLILAGLQIESAPNKAIKSYQQILQIQPEQVLALNNLAWLLAEANQLDPAHEAIKKAIAITPDDANILDTYGYILLKQNQPAPAAAAFEKALSQNPGLLATQFNLAKAYLAQHDTEHAKQTLEALIAQEAIQPTLKTQAQMLLKQFN